MASRKRRLYKLIVLLAPRTLLGRYNDQGNENVDWGAQSVTILLQREAIQLKSSVCRLPGHADTVSTRRRERRRKRLSSLHQRRRRRKRREQRRSQTSSAPSKTRIELLLPAEVSLRPSRRPFGEAPSLRSGSCILLRPKGQACCSNHKTRDLSSPGPAGAAHGRPTLK